jgi:cysteine desulfurase
MHPYYLDCNATTPTEPEVIEVLGRYLAHDFGNAGSRSHLRGVVAKEAVELARTQVAEVVDCRPDEVFFTSGATESDNLAILGLRDWAIESNKRHIITSSIEHHAVLEPLEHLVSHGFEVTFLPCGESGRVSADQVAGALRSDTGLVSIMHVNNETGVEQPLTEIADTLRNHSAFFHVDAAQGFGKILEPLKHPRLDLLSISGHKIYGPKGIGALVARRRDGRRPPLAPLFFGGGQEKGLRPGTLPVALVAGLGEAARIAIRDHQARLAANILNRDAALSAFTQLGAVVNGDLEFVLPHTLNLSFPELNSEAVMLALKGVADLSNGSACTSANYEPSHVLTAMQLQEDRVEGALRFSWSHLTGDVEWTEIADSIQIMM